LSSYNDPNLYDDIFNEYEDEVDDDRRSQVSADVMSPTSDTSDKRPNRFTIPPPVPPKDHTLQEHRTFVFWGDDDDVDVEGLQLLSPKHRSLVPDVLNQQNQQPTPPKSVSTSSPSSPVHKPSSPVAEIPERGTSHKIYDHVVRSNSTVKPSGGRSVKPLDIRKVKAAVNRILSESGEHDDHSPGNSIDSASPSKSYSSPVSPVASSASSPTGPELKSPAATSPNASLSLPSYHLDKKLIAVQVDDMLDSSAKSILGPTPNLDQAVLILQEAQKLASSIGCRFREAKVLNNLACVWRHKGHGEDLFSCLDRSWELAIELLSDVVKAKVPGGLYNFIMEEQMMVETDGASIDPMEFGRQRSIRKVLKMLAACGLGRRAEVSPKQRAATLNRGGKTVKGPSLTKRIIGALASAGSGGIDLDRYGAGNHRSNTTKEVIKPLADVFPAKPLGPIERISVELGPPLLALFMDLCTSYGNAHYSFGNYPDAMLWHQSCLDIAHDAFVTWPFPLRTAEQPLQLSYLHQTCVSARSRSFSHLGLCLQRMGEIHRAVKFQQRALDSLEMLGIKNSTNVPPVRSAVAGNLASAQFDAGRLNEAAKGFAESAKLFADAEDKAGLSRAQNNMAACLIEIGRLGITVQKVLGNNKTRRSPTASKYTPIVVPQRKMSLSIKVDNQAPSKRAGLHNRSGTPPAPPASSMRTTAIGRYGSSDTVGSIQSSSSSTKSTLGSISESEMPQKVPTNRLSAALMKAKEQGPVWFADILSALNLLCKISKEAADSGDYEGVGIARFNFGEL
jgi:tetratricopeptide (TPR) repeat protein